MNLYDRHGYSVRVRGFVSATAGRGYIDLDVADFNPSASGAENRMRIIIIKPFFFFYS